MDFQEHFKILAAYNQAANATLYEMVGKLPDGEFDKNRGSYFGSIHGILRHLITGDINWLRRYRDFFIDLPALQHPRLFPPGQVWTLYDFADFAALARDRMVVDEIFCRFVAAADPGRYGEPFAYVDSHGNPKRYVFWQTLDHVFNHQTHHRGQLSQILDELGVAHDFSNIVGVLKPL